MVARQSLRRSTVMACVLATALLGSSMVWAHGVTSRESNLTYSGESGGLNASVVQAPLAAQDAADICDEAFHGWLSCVPAATPGALSCGCQTAAGTSAIAHLGLVDDATATQYFDGRFLHARDLTDEQRTVRVSVSIWFRGATSGAHVGQVIDSLVTAFEDALRHGASVDHAAELAAERANNGILRHELGHTLGFRHEHTRPPR